VSEAKSASNYATYGVLYNWEAAKTACPSGWHLPSDEEWQSLVDHLDKVGLTAGGKMKETGTSHWLSPNTGATNSSDCTALPGGERSVSGVFSGLGDYAEFWSSTLNHEPFVQVRILFSTMAIMAPDQYDRNNGFSVRCLMD
jgi:uncharacterized protein (TIGR02145 family)